MTKTEAKRLVCRVYASTIESDFGLGAGWLREDMNGAEYPDADQDRIMQAAEDLRDELFRRGEGFYGAGLESRVGIEPT